MHINIILFTVFLMIFKISNSFFLQNVKKHKLFHTTCINSLNRINNLNYSDHVFRKKTNIVEVQYISDIHIDTYKNIPDIIPYSDTLIIAGDIGVPTHVNFRKFLQIVSNRFNNVFFVAGNHEYDSGSIFDPYNYEKFHQIIKQQCNDFNNVHFLDNSCHCLNNDVMIIGSTLWTDLNFDHNTSKNLINKYKPHIEMHKKSIDFIETTLKINKNKKFIVVTHYVPTFKLIEDKYKTKGEYVTNLFASNLEHLMLPNLKVWICGHTHSVKKIQINNTLCCVNAHGYPNENNTKNINCLTFKI